MQQLKIFSNGIINVSESKLKYSIADSTIIFMMQNIILSMNILVILSNSIGDILLSLPFIEGIKLNYPDSDIYTVVNKEFVEIIDLVPLISGSYAKVKSPYSSIVGNLQTANAIRRDQKFELCFCISDSFSASLISFFARTKIRVGYKFAI